MNELRHLDRIRFNTSFDPEQFCAIANFSIDGADPERVTEHLMEKHKIIVTPIVHDEFSGIRITPNIFTKLHELDRFCSIIEAMLKKGSFGRNDVYGPGRASTQGS
jgi:selenocysteine lyase/cysteine desulfurase